MSKHEMKRSELLEIATTVRPALATQAYVPELMHVCFDGQFATAYNDIAAIQVKAETSLKGCVPGELLHKAVTSFAGDKVMLSESDGDAALTLVAGRSRMKLPMKPITAFPFKMPKAEGPFIAVTEGIIEGIERCLPFVGSDTTHPAQMGVTLATDEAGKAVLFSTDNKTASRFNTGEKLELPGDAPVILPTFFCEQLVTLFKKFTDLDVDIYLLDGALLADFQGHVKLLVKMMVDLQPLDFESVFSKNADMSTLSKDLVDMPAEFDGALGRALLLLGAELDKESLVEIGDDSLRFFTKSQTGECTDDVAMKPNRSAPEEIRLDPALVSRGAKNCASIAFYKRALVMAGYKGKFLHLVAYRQSK